MAKKFHLQQHVLTPRLEGCLWQCTGVLPGLKKLAWDFVPGIKCLVWPTCVLAVSAKLPKLSLFQKPVFPLKNLQQLQGTLQRYLCKIWLADGTPTLCHFSRASTWYCQTDKQIDSKNNQDKSNCLRHLRHVWYLICSYHGTWQNKLVAEENTT